MFRIFVTVVKRKSFKSLLVQRQQPGMLKIRLLIIS